MSDALQLGSLASLKSFDNDNEKPIKSLLKGKGLLSPVGLAKIQFSELY
jgi:hypothetical protein